MIMIDPSKMDQTTIDGFAEALMVAMSQCQDAMGRAWPVRFCDDDYENIMLVRQIASRLLGDSKTQALKDVIAERKRQITIKGRTPEHDNKQSIGELAAAAACYALHTEPVGNVGDYLRFWPWAAEWWKPKDRRRNLVKAGALILAEIEHLDRVLPLE